MDLFKSIAVAVLVLNMLSACSTLTPMTYKHTEEMKVSEASYIIERTIMTQYSNWKPSNVDVNTKYIRIDRGTVSSHAINGSYGSTKTKNVSERIYYDNVSQVQLSSWIRNEKQFYVVSVLQISDKRKLHVLRTTSLKDAELFANALESLMAIYKK